jgi:hypothetical protein
MKNEEMFGPENGELCFCSNKIEAVKLNNS